jgi:hypothetical protein
MTPAIAAMVTAIVGVLGTLCAPVLVHVMTARNNRASGQEASARRNFEERRTAYTAINRASRDFDTVLKDALHRLRDGAYGNEERAEVELVRRAYRDRYAEIQMIVPAHILNASREVNAVLAEVDAAVKRLDRKRALDGETVDSVMNDLQKAAPRLHALSEQMRADLGVVG